MVDVSAAVHEKEMHRRISAWVLPVFRPAAGPPGAGPEPRPKPHAWSDPAEVSEAVLELGARLALEPIPAEREHTETHAFKYRAEVGRYVYVQVDKGLRSFGGYLLGERTQRILPVPPFPPAARALAA